MNRLLWACVLLSLAVAGVVAACAPPSWDGGKRSFSCYAADGQPTTLYGPVVGARVVGVGFGAMTVARPATWAIYFPDTPVVYHQERVGERCRVEEL